MLSALATSAVPGFQAVSAQQLSTAELDSALVHDVDGKVWLVELPTSDGEQERFLQRSAAVKALTEGLRQRLDFKVPRIVGATDVQGRTLSVSEYLPGTMPRVKSLTPALATAMGAAIARIHELPTSAALEGGRPHESALDELRDAAGIVDRAAATGLVPQSLLRRWETACEDRGLWQFEPTIVHGLMQLGRFLVEGDTIVSVLGWRTFRIADPARDLAWLTTPTTASFAQAVITSYRSARPGADRWILQRARFWAELDIARWLLHGQDTSNETITHDASQMLQALNDRVSGDLETTLTQPISQQKHPLAT